MPKKGSILSAEVSQRLDITKKALDETAPTGEETLGWLMGASVLFSVAADQPDRLMFRSRDGRTSGWLERRSDGRWSLTFL